MHVSLSLELFEEVFLGRDKPGGHESFAEFATAWRDWIVNDIYPRQYGSQKRELRLERIDHYLAAAERAPLDEVREDLRRRALRELQRLFLDSATFMRQFHQNGTVASIKRFFEYFCRHLAVL